jgi:hypothetical protein
MGHGYDVHCVRVVKIDDRKWEAVKHEPPCSVKILRPAPGCVGDDIESVVDVRKKSNTRVHTTCHVPIVGSLDFEPSFVMEAILLTSPHPGVEL